MIILVQSTKHMRKYWWLIFGMLTINTLQAQETLPVLKKAFLKLEADSQMQLWTGCFTCGGPGYRQSRFFTERQHRTCSGQQPESDHGGCSF